MPLLRWKKRKRTKRTQERGNKSLLVPLTILLRPKTKKLKLIKLKIIEWKMNKS